MTLFHNNVGTSYLRSDINDDSRPQLISRHSSSLPVTNKAEAQHKVLSRRSRSASPCIKKTHSTCSETNQTFVRTNAKGLLQSKRKLAGLIASSPLPVIIRPASHSGKNLKSSRGSSSASKQRSQVLNVHKKNLKSPCVWEQICGVQGDTQSLDVNSNLSYNGSTKSVRHAYNLHQTPNHDLKCKTSHAIAKQEKEPALSCSMFDFLPLEVLLKIFSYLNQVERGRCMFVSKHWYYLTRTPHLWTTVNLREFVLCYGHDTPEPCENAVTSHEEELASRAQCTKVCYGRYIRRVDSYIMFLIDIQVQVKLIAISFDLANDSWMSRIKRLFRHVNFRQLVYAEFDWHVTPVKPMWLVDGQTFRFQDVAYATRRRERHFLDFLQEFVSEMPSLKSLVIPFGWSTRAMRYLTKLPKLNNLVLKKYTVFCTPDQDVLNELANMKNLEKLLIEVWMTSSNPHRYNISSATLKYLDLTQCRSFYLQSVDLPSLEVLKIEKNIRVCETQETLPCLYEVLSAGAPRLNRINNAVLPLMNSSATEYLFNCICPCKKHCLTK